MGGLGSGRRGWLPVVEQGLKLDLRHLRRQGFFDSDKLMGVAGITWFDTLTGSVKGRVVCTYSLMPEKGWLRLQYTASKPGCEKCELDEFVQMLPFKQPYGGSRWYMICPATSQRCQCLYMPLGETHFRSRGAFRSGIQYYSQGQSPKYRLIHQGQNVVEKVLRAAPSSWQETELYGEFPPRPPRMRQQTYDKLLAKWESYESRSQAFIEKFCEEPNKSGLPR